MEHETIRQLPDLPERPADAHKGSVGRILIVGGQLGQRGMIGAPALAANAALRSGAGLVQILTEPLAMPHVAVLAPCATTQALGDPARLAATAVEFGADVVAIGPGLSPAIRPEHVVELLNSFSGGLVVDADALNALAAAGKWKARWPHNVVITPHPGEMQRLLAGYGFPEEVGERTLCATRFAEATGCTVVLKGHGSVVADPRRVYINQTGNAGMATGGTGDVLTGIIAALIGQRMELFDAAVLGVHVHGLAGDNAAEQLGRVSLMATDLLDFLPEAFCDLEDQRDQTPF